MNIVLAQNIKNLRKAKNLSQQKLGKILCVTQQAVGKWENGYSEPDSLTLIKLSKLFNISVDKLLSNIINCGNLSNENYNMVLNKPNVNRLKEIRKSNNLNQSEFAKIFNISQQTLSNWEKGITDINLDTLIAISDTFNISIDYILGKKEKNIYTNIHKFTIGERIYKKRMELGLSVEDIAKKLNKNRATIYRYENNEIEKIPINILEPLAKILHTTPAYIMGFDEDSKKFMPITNYSITKLPIIGTITAGYDGLAYEEDMGEIEVLDTALSGYAPEDCFVLQIKGNSMYPLFLDKDLVLVHKQSHVDSGTIAVVLYNGNEATVKKVIYKQGENWLDLVPTNPEYMTKHIENEDLELCHVIGKIISLVLRKI